MFASFHNLKPFQLIEYICMALLAYVMPISWRIATYVMAALFVSAVLKGIFEEGFAPNPKQCNNKAVYVVFIAFWVMYAVSFLYSDNSAEARLQIGKKLSFLLFPIFFLCSNLSYLNKERVKTVVWCMILGMFSLFVMNFIWAIYDILFNENGIDRLISPYKFFKTDEIIFPYVHRGYFSMMTGIALVFCVVDMFSDKPSMSRIFGIISIIFLVFMPFFLASRAGILCTVLLLFILWIWITFVRKEKKIGILSGVVILCSLVIGYFMFSDSVERITDAVDSAKNRKGDCRITIRNGNRALLADSFVTGVGIGDRGDETLESYERYKDEIESEMLPPANVDVDFYVNSRKILLDSIHAKFGNKCTAEVYEYIDSVAEADAIDYSSVKENIPEYQMIKHCIRYELNAHNQYYDTIMDIGLIGLVLLLGFFVVPIYLWIKNKNFDIAMFSLLFIVAFNCLFESVFERQMGIVFFAFFYLLLSHYAFCADNNKYDKSLDVKQ